MTNVDTSRYEASHGKAPRGFGRWMFRNDETGKVFEATGNFAQARARARSFFRSELQPNHALVLVVMP